MNSSILEDLGYFSEDQLSELTSKEKRTLANWRAKRIGPPFVRRPGKPPLYPRDEALAWLESHRVETSNP